MKVRGKQGQQDDAERVEEHIARRRNRKRKEDQGLCMSREKQISLQVWRERG